MSAARAAALILLLGAGSPAAAQGLIWETAAVPLGGPIKLSTDDVPPPVTRIRIAPERITINFAAPTIPRLSFSLPTLRQAATSHVSPLSELPVRPASLPGPNHILLQVTDSRGPATVSLSRRATIEGYDVTPVIAAARLPLSPFLPGFTERFDRLDRDPAWSRRHGSRGAFASHGLIGPDGADAPLWAIELAFSFVGNRRPETRAAQAAGETTVSYAPIAAQGRLGPGAPAENDVAELRRLFCLTDAQSAELQDGATAHEVVLRYVGFDLDRSWTPLIDGGDTAVLLAGPADGWSAATCAPTRRTGASDTALTLPDSYPTQSGVAHILFWRR